MAASTLYEPCVDKVSKCVANEQLLDDVSEIHAHFKTEKRFLKDFSEDLNPKFIVYKILS